MFSALPQSSYPTVRRSSIQKLFVIWLCPRYDKRRLARVGKDILPSWSSRNCSSTYLLKNIEHRFSMICVNARQWLCEICLVVFLTELKICTFCTRPEFYPLDGTVHRICYLVAFCLGSMLPGSLECTNALTNLWPYLTCHFSDR